MRHWINNFGLILALLIVLTGAKSVYANPPQPISITSLDPSPLKADLQPQLGTTRSQAVQVQTGALNQIAENLSASSVEIPAYFQVFENIGFTAYFAARETTLQGGYILTGSLNQEKEAYITVVSNGDVIGAILNYHGVQYHLEYTKDQQYRFVEIDQTQFPLEADSLIPQIAQDSFVEIPMDEIPLADSNNMIDIMVVYTDDARAASGSTLVIQNLIDLAVSETNTGYQRSGVNHRFRLVHTAEIDFDETNLNWTTALSQITSQDGVADQVRTWRDTYGADLVVTIVNNTTYCGIGWLMTNLNGFDSYGYSLVSRVCATGYYSFAHETGHNMGAHHERASAGTAIYPYAYGYQAPDRSFRTIMAYNCSNGCPRINNWANPEVYINGQPTGILSSAENASDNRLTLNNTAYTVANFRQASLPAPTALSTTETTLTRIGLSFIDSAANETGFYMERSINGGAWSRIATLPANTTTFTDSSMTCSTSLAYRVKAYNANSESAYSNILTINCSAPPAVNEIQTSSSVASIMLAWDDVDGETAYIIEQSFDQAKSWNTIATLSADTTAFTLAGLEPNSNYTFRICTTNPYGDQASDPITISTMNTAIFLPLLLK
ncbi:MAG: hypothetical protein CVU39_04710 [Chloroflexi bacterium HGW-Chloroflexi-10]|nr:MAG: hypothetical protein CVU39_04710 [Chloroflexi bacterium HGW-Chloroflexi-10]